jgi:hypothetical protein
MKKEILEKLLFEDRMGCFGCFEMNDPICRKMCALSLRCAIERDQSDRMEILEELVSGENLLLRMQ